MRNGSQVSRSKYDDLESALLEAEKRTEEILDEGRLKTVKAIRDYPPEKLVKARIEVSGKGLISPPTAGLDIQGDGSLVGFAGGVRRKPLEGDTPKQVIEAMRETLQR